MEFILQIVSGPSAGAEIVIARGQTVSVGRTGRSQFPIAGDQRLSGAHFQVEAGPAGARIRDLGSRNGTFVNGGRVNEAVLQDGDRILAGATNFVFHIAAAQSQAQPQQAAQPPQQPPQPPQQAAQPQPPAPAAPQSPAEQPAEAAAVAATPAPPQQPASLPKPPPRELTPPQKALLSLLREKFQPLFALLDAARDPKIVALLRQSGEQHASLYDGPEGQQLALFAPYIVSLPPASPLLESLVAQGWGNSWGIFLTGPVDLDAARRHFRRFLKVLLPDGKQVYFRFYDPRVLRIYLPTCDGQEAALFFGTLTRFLAEDEDPAQLLEFTRHTTGVADRKIGLLPPEDSAPFPAPAEPESQPRPPAG